MVASRVCDAINLEVANAASRSRTRGCGWITLTISADDEDGVIFGGLFNANSLPAPVTVNVIGDGLLTVWFDWNGDGDFTDAGERVVSNLPVRNGANELSIVTPVEAQNAAEAFQLANPGERFFVANRFRLSSNGTPMLGDVGIGGEVEDYMVEIVVGVPPQLVDDQYSMLEDDVLLAGQGGIPGVLDNDSDIDSASFTVRDGDPSTPEIDPEVNVTRGTLVLRADGSFDYTPDPDFFGTDFFVYRAEDNRLASNAPATVTITVNEVNDFPTAVDDNITSYEDEMLVIAGADLTANDFRGVFGTRSQTNELTQDLMIVDATIVSPDTGVFGGTVSVANNELTFTPGPNYNDQIQGPVLIEVTIEDNGQTFNPMTGQLEDDFLRDTGTLTINVRPVNDSPEFTIDPPVISITEDAGPQTLDPYLIDILPGPADPQGAIDEGTGGISPENQQVTFVTTAHDPSLFAAGPVIDDNGILTFELNPNVNNQPPYPPEILVEVLAIDSASTTSIVRNLFDPAVVANALTYDEALLTVSDLNGNTVVFEFDDANTPGVGSSNGVPHVAISYDGTDTAASIEGKLLAAINAPPAGSIDGPGGWGASAALDSFSGEILISGELSTTTTPGAGLDPLAARQGNEATVRNSFDAGAVSLGSFATYDGSTLTVVDTAGNSVVFELDDAQLPGVGSTMGVPHVAITYDQTDTMATISAKLAAAISDPPVASINGTDWGVDAFVDAETDELRLIGHFSSTASSGVDAFTVTNDFPALGAGETFDGATLSVTDQDGDTIIFEFNDITDTPPAAPGVAMGNSAINYDPSFTQEQLTQAIHDAINNPDPAVVAGLTGSWDAQSLLPMGSNEMQLSNVSSVAVSASAAPIINPLSTDTFSALGIPLDVRDSNISVSKTFTILVEDVNDAPTFDLNPNPVEFLEDAGPQALDDFVVNALPGPADALDEIASQTMMLTVHAADPAAFAVLPAITSFDPVTGTADLTFELGPDVNRDTHNLDIIVTLVDDGGTANGGIDTTVQTLTLDVTPVNDSPLFTLMDTQVNVLEDNELETGVSPTVITGFAENPMQGPATAIDELATQSLMFEVVSVSDTSLFASGPTFDPNGDLIFTTATDQNGSAEVVVRLLDDGDDSTTGNGDDNQSRPDQTFTINIAAVNDAPVFTIPATTQSIEDQGVVQVANFATDLLPGPATATDEIGQTFVVNVQAVDPAAFSIQPAIAADGTLTYQTAADVNSLNATSLDVEVWLVDDGPSTPPDVNTSPRQTFTIIVDPINDAPIFSLNQNLVQVIEDVEDFEGTVNTEVIDLITDETPGPITATDEAGQTLTFEVVSVSAPELFEVQPTVVGGDLTFRTADHQNGSALVVIRLSDDGTSAPPPHDNTSLLQTLTITIDPINDAPEFDVPPSVTVNEDAGLVSLSGFATDVRRGPAGTDDENGQQVNFMVTATDPSAFSQQPQITPDGTLSFQTAPDVNSNNANLEVVVKLIDSGAATPPPNENTSVEQTFTIIANPVNDPPIADSFERTAVEDQPITISAADVLAGDVPGPGDEIAEGQTIIMTQIERTTALGGTVEPVFNGDEIVSFTYTPATDREGSDTFVYVITDDGTPAQSGAGTITINITGVNDPPQFNRGADQVASEDADRVTVAGWATNILAGPPAATGEQATQTVSFDVTADDTSLFEEQPAISSDGTLTFKPALDANGTAVVTVIAVDDGPSDPPNVNQSAPQTFTITIDPVNDAPVFTAGPDVTVPEDSGAFAGTWATGIAPAAGILGNPATATDEAGQIVDFAVTNDQPALFSVQPIVTSNGELQFTPALNAVGSAVVTVTAVDRGPTGGQNMNTSVSQTLTITVTPVNDAPQAVADNYIANENSILSVPAAG